MTPAPFPWRQAIGVGLGILGLSPDAFWRMTPREFAFALGALSHPAEAPLEQSAFRTLMERFPDGR